MSEQNLLGIGFDKEKIRADAAEVEQIVTQLYEKLKGLDGAKLSPIDVTGLQQLTQAIQQQQGQMNSLTQSVNNLSQAMNNYNSTLANSNTNTQNNIGNTGASTQAVDANTKAVEANTKALQANATAGKGAGKTTADALKDAKQKVKEIGVEYTNAFNAGAPKAQLDAITVRLQGAQGEVKKMEKALSSAGGETGLGSLLKGSGSFLNQIRQLAYILPGIGMAGIFNLAFEALSKIVEEMGLFEDEITKEIALEKELADAAKNTNKILTDRQNILNKDAKDNVEYYERILKIDQASGVSYDKQIEDINNLNNAKKLLGQTELDNLGLTEETGRKEVSLNKGKLETLLDQRQKFNEFITNVTKDAAEVDKETILKRTDALLGPYGVAREAIKGLQKYGEKIADKDLKEWASSQLAVFDQQYSNLKERTDLIQKGIDDTVNARTDAQAEAEKQAKFWDDEARKRQLGAAEQNLKLVQYVANETLKSDKSTHDAKIQALDDILKAQNRVAEAQMLNITKDVSRTPAERALAESNYGIQTGENQTQRNEQALKINDEFLRTFNERILKAVQERIRTNQVYDKAILDDETESYNKRLEALGDYIGDREAAIEVQYQHDIELMKQLPEDQQSAQKKFLDNQKNAQYADIFVSIRKQSYELTSNYDAKQLKEIQDNDEAEVNSAKDAQTKKLIDLEQSFAQGKISWRKYQNELKDQTYKGQLDIDLAQIKALNEDGVKLKNQQTDLKSKLEGEINLASMAGNEDQYQEALGNAQAYSEGLVAVNKKINENNSETTNANYKYSKDLNERQDAARKQTAENWAKLEKEVFDDVKQVTDSYYEDRISQIEHLTEIQDKATENEISAIQRSTLAAKDKNAYEVQLAAQKEQRDREAAKEERKLKHDEAVFNKAVGMDEIIINTAIAVTEALKIPVVGEGLAVSIGALGATELATAAATKIPSYAEGGVHKKEGPALFGEAGYELVKEPGVFPFIAKQPTVKNLKAGTELIPLYDIPIISERRDTSWEQTIYLGKQIAKSKREIKNVFKPKINVDLGTELYKNRILYGL